MLISLAEVRDTFDPRKNNSFLCKIKSLGDAEKSVKWTAPVATGGNLTFITPPPTPGTLILVTQPDGCGDWYYLCSTFAEEPVITATEETEEEAGGAVGAASQGPVDLDGDGEVSQAEADQWKKEQGSGPLAATNVPPAARNQNQEQAGASTGIPETIIIKGDSGAGMEITNLRSPKAQELGVKLFTERGKVISLNDAPLVDSIVITTTRGSKNEQGICTFTMGDAADHPNTLTQPYEAKLVTTGYQNFWCTESGTYMRVLDGLELDIRNQSVGTNKNPDEPDLYGNVTIQSDQKDINVFALDDTGEGARIFIECLNPDGKDQLIEIQTNGADGAIRIKTNGKVDIEADKIGINAFDQIDMKAGGKINIEAGADLSLKSGGTVYSDGSPDIRLNEGGSTAATPEIGNDESYYENHGLLL